MASSSPADALRGLLPDLYFVNTSFTQMDHHRALLDRLPQERRLIEFLHQRGALLTELSLCAYDDLRPGLLAKICGTLAALSVNVHTASVFTLRNAQHAEAPIILDTLMVSETYRGHDRKLRHAREEEIRDTLAQVIEGHITVPQLLTKAPRRLGWPLRIAEVAAESAPLPDQIALTVHVSRHPMALFRMAAAIAALNLDTQSAQIHSTKNGAHGHFFVTGHLPSTSEVPAQLRHALQTNAVPWNLANPD